MKVCTTDFRAESASTPKAVSTADRPKLGPPQLPRRPCAQLTHPPESDDHGCLGEAGWVRKRAVVVLEAFGVDPAAEAVYVEMLREPELGVAALAQRLGCSTAEIRTALNTLAQLSLLRPSSADPKLVRPVDPDVGFQTLIMRQQAELELRQRQLEFGEAALRMFVAEHGRQGLRPAVQIEEWQGIDAVRDGLERLAQRARREVLSFAPGGAHTPNALASSEPLNERVLERGVQMRTIYLDSIRNDPSSLDHARWLIERGADVRTVSLLPLRMLIFDQDAAVVPIDPDRSSAGAVVLQVPGTIAALRALFEQFWRNAQPLGSGTRPKPAQALTPQERALLERLMSGDTDEQAARKLGISVRTVGRIASELMAALGARSRFQLGALAVRRGLLDPEQ